MFDSNLKFREDGTFRILMMSDLQESANFDPRSLRSMEALLDDCAPDLVILGGDNCYGPEINSHTIFFTGAAFPLHFLMWFL